MRHKNWLNFRTIPNRDPKRVRSRDHFLKFWDPLFNFGTAFQVWYRLTVDVATAISGTINYPLKGAVRVT